jgi:enoyl-CoA hydratase
MKTYEFLEIKAGPDGVVVVQMNRPPVNAVHQPMYREIFDFFGNPRELGDEARCIVLAGNGPHFCAGNDLEEFAQMTPQNGTERMWRVREAFFAVQNCVVPVIGAVHGVALGTGLALAASCDFVVAAADSRFGLPELTVGVLGGARHLARLAPEPLMRRMFFTGEPLGAEEFAAAGGAINLCGSSNVLSQALAFARRVAQLSPTAVRMGKCVLNRVENMDIRSGYEFEQSHTVQMSGHPDAKEALRAFRERRPPVYLPFES